MNVSSDDVQALLAYWRDSQQDLYVVFYKDKHTDSFTGRITSVADDEAMAGDAAMQVRIPIREAMKATVTMRDQRVGSITITWSDGASAFTGSGLQSAVSDSQSTMHAPITNCRLQT